MSCLQTRGGSLLAVLQISALHPVTAPPPRRAEQSSLIRKTRARLSRHPHPTSPTQSPVLVNIPSPSCLSPPLASTFLFSNWTRSLSFILCMCVNTGACIPQCMWGGLNLLLGVDSFWCLHSLESLPSCHGMRYGAHTQFLGPLCRGL